MKLKIVFLILLDTLAVLVDGNQTSPIDFLYSKMEASLEDSQEQCVQQKRLIETKQKQNDILLKQLKNLEMKTESELNSERNKNDYLLREIEKKDKELSDTGLRIPKLNGTIGCNSVSKCWKYCEGFSGKWCYTGQCNNQDQCALIFAILVGEFTFDDIQIDNVNFTSEEPKLEVQNPCLQLENQVFFEKKQNAYILQQLEAMEEEKNLEIALQRRNNSDLQQQLEAVNKELSQARLKNPKPNGSTGCNSVSRCWRFCEGSSGKWCYTGTIGSCINNNEQCTIKTTCVGGCKDSEDSCVQTC